MHLGRLPTEKLRSAFAIYTCVCRGTTFIFQVRQLSARYEGQNISFLKEEKLRILKLCLQLHCLKKRKESRESRARDLQTSRADDLVPQGHGQDDEESLGSQMFTAYSISLEEAYQDPKVIPESEESIQDHGLVPQVVSQSGKDSRAP
ncbi:hypothetical protein OIU77_018702 [Salix suchowensis]|uniref:Uncharacterized protein n=1 Tax=Salix suchowensis TaxID=1278906 RepID=A0ABQ9CDI3_9ROSI|nr:hypothetical protein OIU77_018702 [Salix suchowensis]